MPWISRACTTCQRCLRHTRLKRSSFNVVSRHKHVCLFVFFAADEGDLCRVFSDVGVRRALVVGCGLQMFQQLSGINTVMWVCWRCARLQAGVCSRPNVCYILTLLNLFEVVYWPKPEIAGNRISNPRAAAPRPSWEKKCVWKRMNE